MNVTFNPTYILRPDQGKALILTLDVLRASEKERYENVIHPIHAMILSFFNGGDYHESVDQASKYLKTSHESILKLTNAILNNPISTRYKYGDHTIVFPPMTLIESAQQNTRTYNPTDFAYTQVTLKLGRHQRITDVTLMLNNECATDCIYCYANKAKKVLPMPLNKVLSLIDEAKKLELRSFDVIGGDIFVYPHWKVVIKKLYDNGFLPFVSTKVPIKKADIAYLKSIGIKDIQVSLDTLIPEHLHAIVRTNANYCEQIKQTLQELSRNNIEVIIHTIVCSQNCTIEDMKSLYHFIQELPLISKWRIDIANYSLYKTEKEFHQYRATASEVQVLYRYLRELKPDKLTIMCGGIDMENSMQKRPDPNFLTHNRIICTANYSGLFVLPDGLVTICEQLYWNPNFIVGDVKMQSLIDIWNSSKAYDLFVLKQCNLRGDSACKKCDKFVFCRQENGGVCWRDVMATFGACNWDFPDPRCDKAPTALYQVTVV